MPSISRARLTGFLVCLALLTGCETVLFEPTVDTRLAPVRVTASARSVPEWDAPKAFEPVNVSLESDGLWQAIGSELSWDFQDPDVATERERWLAQPNLFKVLSERALPALPLIFEEIRARGLPMEVILVPLVESTLDPRAYSSQRAAGLWQISPATAAHYQVPVDWWYDGRLDIAVATGFALDYLVELNTLFDGDWPLTLAAYNGGRGRVARALNKAGGQAGGATYWTIDLPRETRRYLPKILALSQLIRAPKQFGLTLPTLPTTHSTQVVDTGGPIEMSRVAELADLSIEALYALNPAILRWATPPEGPHRVRIPAEKVEQLTQGIASLAPGERVRWARHVIQPGDSLIRIARRYGTRVSTLRAVNKLDGNLIRAGDMLMVPRGPSGGEVPVLAVDWPPEPKRRERHKVVAGDSLWAIARRYGVTVQALARWNSLDPTGVLRPGQVLSLRQ